jgi:hypothetical protein
MEVDKKAEEPFIVSPKWQAILFAFLPPSWATYRLSAQEKQSHIFPYSMSTSHSWMVYLTTILISAILFYEQNKQFEIWYPHHPRSVAETAVLLDSRIERTILYLFRCVSNHVRSAATVRERRLAEQRAGVGESEDDCARKGQGGGESLVRGW